MCHSHIKTVEIYKPKQCQNGSKWRPCHEMGEANEENATGYVFRTTRSACLRCSHVDMVSGNGPFEHAFPILTPANIPLACLFSGGLP